MSTLPPPTMLPPTMAPPKVAPQTVVVPKVVVPMVPEAERPDHRPGLEAQARFISDLGRTTRRHEARHRRRHLLHRAMGSLVVLMLCVGAYEVYHLGLYDVRRYMPSAAERFADAGDITRSERTFSVTFPASPDEVRRDPQAVVDGVTLTSTTWTVQASDTRLQVDAVQLVGATGWYDGSASLGAAAQLVFDRLQKEGATLEEQLPSVINGVQARHFSLKTKSGEGELDLVRNGDTIIVLSGTCKFDCPAAGYAEMTSSLIWTQPSVVDPPA